MIMKTVPVDYVLDKDKKTVLAVSHPDWNFVITRSEDNKRTAFVMKESDESFGELDSDAFNTVLMSWLLIDDPKLIDVAQE